MVTTRARDKGQVAQPDTAKSGGETKARSTKSGTKKIGKDSTKGKGVSEKSADTQATRKDTKKEPAHKEQTKGKRKHPEESEPQADEQSRNVKARKQESSATKDSASKAAKTKSTATEPREEVPAEEQAPSGEEDGAETDQKPASSSGSKMERLLSKFGKFPLSDVGLPSPHEATSETILAHLLNALLSSGRIGHSIAEKTLRCLIDAGYHNVTTLKEGTWQRRTEILTDGGYTRYREKMATQLGDLADWIVEKYDSDLTSMIPSANTSSSARAELSKTVKEIKGLGPLGTALFLNTIQAVAPNIAPYIDDRNVEAAERLGLKTDASALFKELGEDAGQMGRLVAALTHVRLEGLWDQVDG